MRLPDGRIRKLRKSSDDPNVAHSFTFSCFRRQQFLTSERARLWLTNSLATARHKHALDIWAYVFMPEHVHLVLWPREPLLSTRAVLASIKLPVTRRTVAYVRKHAPSFLPRMLDRQPNGESTHRFWQRGGGYDRDLSKPKTIHATIDYIHENPVRRGLVESPDQWRWSSAAFYFGTGESPLRPDVESIPEPPPHWKFFSCRS